MSQNGCEYAIVRIFISFLWCVHVKASFIHSTVLHIHTSYRWGAHTFIKAHGMCLCVCGIVRMELACVSACALMYCQCMHVWVSEREPKYARTHTHGKRQVKRVIFCFKLIHYVVTLWQEKSLHEIFIYDVTKNIYFFFSSIFFGEIGKKSSSTINIVGKKIWCFEGNRERNLFDVISCENFDF